MEKKVNFISAGKQLAGTLFLPEIIKKKNLAILFLHGHTSRKENSYQYASALVKLGYLCLAFEMRGHGESEGAPENELTLKNFLEDSEVAYDYLAGLDNVDKESISVVGSSMGGYLAALLSSRKGVKNLVLRAPADYPNDVFDKPVSENGADNPRVLEFRKRVSVEADSLALESLAAFHGDVLIIESEMDDRVPHPTMENYANAVSDKSKLEHVVIKDAPHSLKEGKFRDEAEAILIRWFMSHV